jgi:hypothetical protein
MNKSSSTDFGPVAFSEAEREHLYKSRSNAFAIDLILGIFLFVLAVWIGAQLRLNDPSFLCLAIIGLSYFLLKDAMPNGRSLGKLFFGLQTVDVKTRRACGMLRSVSRNLILWFWILGPIAAYSLIELFCRGVLGLELSWLIKGAVLLFIVVPLIKSERNRIRENVHGQTHADKWTGTQVIHFQRETGVIDES